MYVEFYGLRFDLPCGWTDITDDLPEGSPPTLAKPDGVGAIQFSIARHRGGENPRTTIEQLENMLEDFCSRNSLPCQPIRENFGDIISATAVSEADGVVTAAWLLSNGMDVMLATYNASDVQRDRVDGELIDARSIVRSMSF